MAVISDVHLGSKRNRAADIITNLNNSLLNKEQNKDLDILVFAGDLFDNLLSLQDDSVTDIFLWFGKLFSFCEKYDIILRVLEGTPSHDRMQSIHLENVAKIRSSVVNFKYVKTLQVEYFPEFDINVLYVPDEWNHDPNDTLQEAKQLIESKGLKQVDLAIMHGNFEYQLPASIKGIPRHDSQAYGQLVKHYIFIGHIHTFSTLNNKIIAQGSFDRLTHNEEEPKGYVKAVIDLKTNHKSFFFIENTGARIYKTISVLNMELQNSLSFIKNKTKDYPHNAAIRISAQKNHPIFTNFHEVMSMYPTYTWTKHVVEKDVEENQPDLIDNEIDYIPITLHKDNITQLIMDRLKQSKDTQTINYCNELLSKTLLEVK